MALCFSENKVGTSSFPGATGKRWPSFLILLHLLKQSRDLGTSISCYCKRFCQFKKDMNLMKLDQAIFLIQITQDIQPMEESVLENTKQIKITKTDRRSAFANLHLQYNIQKQTNKKPTTNLGS